MIFQVLFWDQIFSSGWGKVNNRERMKKDAHIRKWINASNKVNIYFFYYIRTILLYQLHKLTNFTNG